jgi:imidazolonepropionase-like amidohydrolase
LIALLSVFVTAPHAGAPEVYAIRGARIVTATGQVIESGTLVIRNGVIEAVGASAPIPPDADVIAGTGLTVYPGLIDLGNARAADQPLPPQPSNLRTTADLERWKRTQILRPQARAADTFKVDSTDLTQLASAGITSVLATPAGEVVAGQSALVNVVAPPDSPQIGSLVTSRRGQAVVRATVALHVSIPERTRAAASAYPESLMGMIAFVRQSFLDAQHYAAERAHDQRVKAMDRGAPDETLEALQAALDRRIPVAFEANASREILRALKLAGEFKLDPIVTGARNAEEVTQDLKAARARVIFSLNFPQRPKTLSSDADEPLRVIRERTAVMKVPAELAKAGVSFGFESAGLADAKDFLKNAARVVKAGLPAEAAVRALTIDAARIAGAAERLGSLEKGKIANVVVTDGDLFETSTVIRYVFIDGRPIKLAEPARGRPGAGGELRD